PNRGATRIAPAVPGQKGIDLAEARQLLLPGAEAAERNASRGSLAFDPHLKPVGGQNGADRLGPFRNHDASGAHLVEAGLFLVAGTEPEKIAMIDRAG